jgi:hypothetical protein
VTAPLTIISAIPSSLGGAWHIALGFALDVDTDANCTFALEILFSSVSLGAGVLLGLMACQCNITATSRLPNVSVIIACHKVSIVDR